MQRISIGVPWKSAGEATIGLWLGLGSIVAGEIVARAGFDWVVADLEHGMAGETELLGTLVAVQGTATAALVRPVSAERLRVGRVLDLGADGLVRGRGTRAASTWAMRAAWKSKRSA